MLDRSPMVRLGLLALPLAASLASLPVHAETMPKPKVDFSAEGFVKTPQMTIDSKLYYSHEGKERREHVMQGMSQVIIVRHDKKVVWVLMPDQKMYMEVDLNSAQGMAGDMAANAKLDRTKVGEETVNGEKTTKYKTTISQQDGASLSGFMWVTPDDIVMKVDATAAGEGKSMDFKMELKNIKKAKQDASLAPKPGGPAPSAGSSGLFGKPK